MVNLDMEESQSDFFFNAVLFIAIVSIVVILFLFIWKNEAHPDSRFKFRALTRQSWKIIFLVILIAMVLILLFDSIE